MYKLLAFFMMGLTLVGCSNTKRNLGLVPDSPDEFQVVQRAPLEIPDSYELPPPRPGAARPQEANIPDVVKQALTGQSTRNVANVAPSRAEQALLQKTEAIQASDDIRQVVDQETRESAESDKSVAKRLLGVGGLNRKDGVLDAEQEAKRLEKQNIPHGNE
jgi:hypothetical protein